MNDNIIERSKAHYVPILAIIVYQNPQWEYYLEMHGIDNRGRLLAGAPLSEECITKLATGFSAAQSRIPHGAIPANMLFCDLRPEFERYVWYNPPRRRMMYFTGNMNIPSGRYHVPGVVYDIRGARMDIYAYKGGKPSANAQLYLAPFFNVTGSAVCLGNAKLEPPASPCFEEFMLYWEKKFWMTEFSHLGGSQNPTRNNLVAVTLQSAHGFDYAELLPHKRKLSDLLKQNS